MSNGVENNRYDKGSAQEIGDVREYVDEHFSYLLASGISEESMKKYLSSIYEELTESSFDDETYTQIVKEIMNSVFHKTDNYEIFVKALLKTDGEPSNFFLKYIGKAIKEMSADEIAQDQEAFYNEDIFGKNSKIRQGYFVSSLIEEKMRLEGDREELTKSGASPEELQGIDEKIMRIDSILGIVNKKHLEYRKKHERVSTEECYIGSVSFKIDKMKEEIVREVAKAAGGEGVSIQEGGDFSLVDYEKIGKIVEEAVRSIANSLTIQKPSQAQSVAEENEDTLSVLFQTVEEISNQINALSEAVQGGLSSSGGDSTQMAGEEGALVEKLNLLTDAVGSISAKLDSLQSGGGTDMENIQRYLDGKFMNVMELLGRVSDTTNKIERDVSTYIEDERRFIENVQRQNNG